MTTGTQGAAAIATGALLGVLMAIGGAAYREGQGGVRAQTDPTQREVRATLRTDWLAPLSARRSLDERNQALERWVSDRGGSVRILDTGGTLRTRGTSGKRLETPLAQFERTLVIRVPPGHAPPDLELALAGLDVTVASRTAHGAARTRVEF